MSNTRKAMPGTGFRQERFASSVQFQRGLMANLVARRCELLTSREDKELIWFLQLMSHQEGGLVEFCQGLLKRYPEATATASMKRFGVHLGQHYSAQQVKVVRAEIPGGVESFPLTGELPWTSVVCLPAIPEPHEDPLGNAREWAISKRKEADESAAKYPNRYLVDFFVDACLEAANELPQYLAELCLNPESDLAGGPWYFPDLVDTLRSYKDQWIEERRAAVTFTALGTKVCDTLNYSLEGRCLTIIDGLARTGKTHAAKAWCDSHPGSARYVQVPSTNDEAGFFRAIAKALGVSINLNSKAMELRQRVEDTLQTGQLMLVLDEAHYLWPNLIDQRTIPARINWIMTALVNQGVPVAMVTTPQFLKSQKAVEDRTRWTSEQFIGRIAHYEPLPDSLSEEDLFAVAKAVLPEGDSASLELLVRYAQGSTKYLAAIESATRRARFLAKRDGRAKVSKADLRHAISGSVIPSDRALAQAMNAVKKVSRRQSVAAPDPEPEFPTASRIRRDRVELQESDRVQPSRITPEVDVVEALG